MHNVQGFHLFDLVCRLELEFEFAVNLSNNNQPFEL